MELIWGKGHSYLKCWRCWKAYLLAAEVTLYIPTQIALVSPFYPWQSFKDQWSPIIALTYVPNNPFPYLAGVKHQVQL